MGVNYERWGYLSGAKAIELLKGRRVTKPIEPITEMELIVNIKAGVDQGLNISQGIIDKATRVID
ncbi:MAG: hypothetical protein PF436_00005 [Prolixibacteraceae bacterium]|nr:hypothetical protein [Prolixibacteraceae bacterium]